MSVKVSVLLPSLNVGKYIEQCLKSVIDQDLKDIEILCIDAGSTDGTLETIQKYADKDSRIRIINSEKKSYGYQMNLGMKNAAGDYIGIVETDDYIEPDMYKKLVETAESFQADAVKGNYYTYEGGKNTKYSLFAAFPYNRVINAREYNRLFGREPSIWTGLYRKEFIEKNGICFSETPGASYQDAGFIHSVWICAEKVVLVDQPYYHYRTDNENSSVHSKEKVYAVCDEYDRIVSFAKEHHADKKSMCAIWAVRADAYFWNLERIDEKFKPEFIQHMHDEFTAADKEGEIDLSMFPAQIRGRMKAVLNNPEQYKESEPGRLEELYYNIDRHGLKYMIENKLNRKMGK